MSARVERGVLVGLRPGELGQKFEVQRRPCRMVMPCRIVMIESEVPGAGMHFAALFDPIDPVLRPPQPSRSGATSPSLSVITPPGPGDPCPTGAGLFREVADRSSRFRRLALPTLNLRPLCHVSTRATAPGSGRPVVCRCSPCATPVASLHLLQHVPGAPDPSPNSPHEVLRSSRSPQELRTFPECT